MKKSKLFDKNSFQKQRKQDWSASINHRDISFNYKNKSFDPIYFKDEINDTTTFNKNGEWLIASEVDIISEKKANKEAIKLLEKGVDSITFLNFKKHNLEIILKNIQIDIIRLNFKKIEKIDFLINSLVEIAKQRQINTQQLFGSFYIKNISKKDYTNYIKILPKFHYHQIDISSFNYQKIDKTFLDPTNILFTYKPSSLFLGEISYLRAFRINFEKIFHSPPYIECRVKVYENKTHPLIESCTKSIGAILGGCDSLIIDSIAGKNLNIQQQLILKYESFFNKVADSLNGSYLIEKITQEFLLKKQNSYTNKTKNTTWETAEGIKLKSKYSIDDIKKIQHLDYGVGKPPFLRGPYSTMYCDKKWTIRQYAGFSTAEESNKFYKKNLKAGQSGLSVAFDLPTHRGYDSNHPRVLGDVGKAGVAIDSVEDMSILFDGIDLHNTSVSMTMNGAILPIMAFFIVVAKRKKIPLSKISGTIQNDILKEFMVRNTYIYPPNPSMRIISDIFKYTSKYMPKFNSISVSGYHMLEAGASADIEIAYTLADGLEYVRTGINSGLKIDEFAPRLSFFWGVGMNFFTEIAKIRAARILWAEMMQKFKPKNPKSMMLRSHCQTSGWSLIAQEPENNITRTTIEAVAAVLAGTQSLHTNALDEAMSLPTEKSAKIARDTQLFLQKETDICKTIDPFGGSYYLEKVTHEILTKAKNYIKEIEKAGGMSKAIEKGIPKLKIEASAIKRQANIDNANNLIIGLNCFQNKKNKDLNILEINNKKVQKKQIQKLEEIKESRNPKLVKKYLDKISQGCATNKQNLLSLAIQAAENKATLGEISYACEKIFGRYQANTIINSGIYAMEQNKNKQFILAQTLTEKFKHKYGRRPRILTAKLGQDGHDRGVKIIATSFSDMGFDVDIAPLFQTPEEIAKQAIENDVHIIGISSLAGGHKTLIPNLIQCLKELGNNNTMVIAGGIIPKKDYQYLINKGVKKIFGPGTIVVEAALEILKELI